MYVLFSYFENYTWCSVIPAREERLLEAGKKIVTEWRL